MLERARSTTFALLGVTAAVGLATVALALNQSWPLIAGSSIPQAPVTRQGVAAAIVVAASDHRRSAVVTNGANPPRPSTPRLPGADGATPANAVPIQAGGPVVSHPVPTRSAGGISGDAPKAAKPPSKQPQQPVQQPAGAPAPAPAPASAPAAADAPLPEIAEPPPPPVATPEAPAEESESNVPAWSHGKGHAYGRSEDE